MRFLTRTVLTWLLALAIPLQGFAASAMLFCAPGHSGMVAVTEYQPTSHHQHETQASHHNHKTAAPTSMSHTDDATPSPTESAKVGQLGEGKCSTCASCCTGSVLVSTLSANPPVAMTGSASIPFTLAPFASHVPEGFDPPPRATLV